VTSPFENDSANVGPPLTAAMVAHAEHVLGVRLPQSYVDLLYEQNGGILRNSCFPTPFRTSWAPDHISLDVLSGIGGTDGIDVWSAYLVGEWGYPDVGVVIGITPSAGHDTVMLDYSVSGPMGEPAVVYVDEERIPLRIADSFAEFIDGLVPCERYEIDDTSDETN
jgi:hypothetical protein